VSRDDTFVEGYKGARFHRPTLPRIAAKVRPVHTITVLAYYLEVRSHAYGGANTRLAEIVAVATISHAFTISYQIGQYKNMWRIGPRRDRGSLTGRSSMSLLGKLAEARAELDARHEDPWGKKVKEAVRGKDAISTAALLDLLRAPATTGTARRLAALMRSLNFIPIKSRRLMPGGRAGNTVTRGWARPVRKMKSSPTTCNPGRAGFNQQGMIP
jgi:hypothetical protein